MKTAQFTPNGLPTLIGSLPVRAPSEALDLIFAHTPRIPLWPQLPGIPQEGMLQQFIEGFPGIIEEQDKTYFNTLSDTFEEEILAFFEEYLALADDPSGILSSRFGVSESRARGLYTFKKSIQSKDNISALKGQITGPFTLLTGLYDQDQRLGYYDPTIREMAVKGLAMKSAWQINFLKDAGYPVILFIDEPALAGLGSSAFISVSKEDISQDLTELITAIHQNDGLAGVHVCANTDWNLLLSLDLDVISFDAYSFFDRFAINTEQVNAYLDRGGIIAWGLVPTSEKEYILKETIESLVKRWEEQADLLVNDQRDRKALLQQTLITPSCGTGSLTYDLAIKVLELTRDLSAALRNKYLA
ncbi:MAG: hypothetical protein KKE17_10095 [Proteobacteria bacterium]|nr:hypothetical protein [Pseudomonadota bacterium]MBU1710341.1 hypothetical protein [Pseudomonadota bacterium]